MERFNTITKSIAPDFRSISPEKSLVLPRTAMMIPVVFWASLIIILIAALLIGRKGNELAIEASNKDSSISNMEGQIIITDKSNEALQARIVDAENIYRWVTQVPMIQPFLVEFFKSFDDEDRVSRITLKYSKQNRPGQFEFQTAYQGEATDITSLFQKNIVNLARSGWSLAQSARKIQGTTVVIDSFIRVDKKSPWGLFGTDEAGFLESINKPFTSNENGETAGSPPASPREESESL